jgi:hypothetical protein
MRLVSMWSVLLYQADKQVFEEGPESQLGSQERAEIDISSGHANRRS